MNAALFAKDAPPLDPAVDEALLGQHPEGLDVGLRYFELSYDAQGRLLHKDFSDGTFAAYAYDARGRMASAARVAAPPTTFRR